MNDIQKLKALMAKYNSVVKKKGYDDGGTVSTDSITGDGSGGGSGGILQTVGKLAPLAMMLLNKGGSVKGYDDGGEVTPQDLAPYMPTPQEEAASGFPPGPQRASYIANKKYQAVQAAKPTGYDNGGTVSKGNVKAYEQISNGFTGKKVEDPNTTTNGPDGQSINAEDAADAAEKDTADQWQKAHPGQKNPNAYADGGEVTPDDNQHLEQVLEQMPENSSSETPSPSIALPNGGLDGQALLNYIKANPGPVATTGLNPNNPGSSSDEDSNEEEPDAKVTLPKSTIKKAIEKEEDSDDTDDNSIDPGSIDSDENSDKPSLLNNTNPNSDDAKSSIQDMLNSVANSGKQQGNSGVSLDDLKSAQQHDKIFSALAGIFGGQASKDSYLKNGQVEQLQQQGQVQSQNSQLQAQQMQNQLTQYKLADEKEKNDVNSPASQFAQSAVSGTYKQLGMTPPPGLMKLSASSIEQSPVLDKMLTAQSNNLTKQMIAQSKLAQVQAGQTNKQNQQDTKQSKDDEKTQAAIGKDLNSLTASSRNALGIASKAKVSAQRLKDIVSDPNATNQDLQSAYADMNAIISGSATQGGTEHQAYQTLQNDISQKLQYITGHPNAPDIPAIKQHVANVADRMSAISDGVIAQNTKSVQANRSGWISRHPEDWKSMVEASTQSPNRAPQSTQSSNSTITPDVLSYAKQHNLTPAQALQIKLSRTGGQ